MPSLAYSLTAAKPSLQATGLGFTAGAVLVTNYTNQYVRIPDAPQDVPPFTFGAVVPLPSGIRQARASLVPTVPAVAGPPVSGAVATLTWVDADLAPDPGHLLQQSQFATQPQIEGPVAVAAGVPVTHNNVPVPSGTHALMVLLPDGPPGSSASTVSFIGAQTGEDYPIATFKRASGSRVFLSFWSSFDTSINITYANGDVGTQHFYLLAVLDPEVVAFLTGQVQLLDSAGNQVFADGAGNLEVTQQFAQPAAWQAADSYVAMGFNIAAGGTQSLVAAVAGQRVYLHGCSLCAFAANGFGALEASDGSNILQFTTGAYPGQSHYLDFKGAKLPLGLGVRLHNTSAVQISVNGALSYRQTA